MDKHAQGTFSWQAALHTESLLQRPSPCSSHPAHQGRTTELPGLDGSSGSTRSTPCQGRVSQSRNASGWVWNGSRDGAASSGSSPGSPGRGSPAGTDPPHTGSGGADPGADPGAARPQRCRCRATGTRVRGQSPPSSSSSRTQPPPQAKPFAVTRVSGEPRRADRAEDGRGGAGTAGDSRGTGDRRSNGGSSLPFPSSSAGARAASAPSQWATHSFRLA